MLFYFLNIFYHLVFYPFFQIMVTMSRISNPNHFLTRINNPNLNQIMNLNQIELEIEPNQSKIIFQSVWVEFLNTNGLQTEPKTEMPTLILVYRHFMCTMGSLWRNDMSFFLVLFLKKLTNLEGEKTKITILEPF